jgi:hypothetical protein
MVAAVGCSDLAPPSEAAWLKRVDDQITVGCYMSRQSWQLNCVNGVWKGTVGICHRADNDDTCWFFTIREVDFHLIEAKLKCIVVVGNVHIYENLIGKQCYLKTEHF